MQLSFFIVETKHTVLNKILLVNTGFKFSKQRALLKNSKNKF
jgi:hypothetical protein